LQLAFALCRLDCIFPAALWRYLLAKTSNSFLQSLAMRPSVTRTKLAKETKGLLEALASLEYSQVCLRLLRSCAGFFCLARSMQPFWGAATWFGHL
jgi:hypothetical protein